jgi:hypothetical protein
MMDPPDEEETTVDVSALLIEGFSRVHEHVRTIAEGMSAEELATVPEPGSNSVGWLLWHLTRVQDHHVSELLGREQVWDFERAEMFGLRVAEQNDVGYGHTPEQVAAIRPRDAYAVVDYYGSVEERTSELLESLNPAKLDEIVDRRWDPPVTMGVRLVSILDDDIQHAGQAAYVKGLLSRR